MAESSNYAQPCIPKFDGDYEHWSMLMENLLRSNEYWSVIETGYVEPQDVMALTSAEKIVLQETKLKDLKAKNYLFQSIDKSILKIISQKDTKKQLWDSMKVKYQGNARIYHVKVKVDTCTEEECLELLKRISCDNRFITCSIEDACLFYAELNEEEAVKLEGLNEIFCVVRRGDVLIDL